MADDDQISDAVAAVVETMRTSDDFKRVVSAFQLAGPPGQFARQLHADLCSAAREMRRKCRAKQIDIGRDELEAALVAVAALRVLQPHLYESCFAPQAKATRGVSRRVQLSAGLGVVDLQEVARFVGRMRAARLDVVCRIDKEVERAAASANEADQQAITESQRQEAAEAAPNAPAASDDAADVAADARALHGSRPAPADPRQRTPSGQAATLIQKRSSRSPTMRDASPPLPAAFQAPILVAAVGGAGGADGAAASASAPQVPLPPIEEGPEALFHGEGEVFAMPFSTAVALEEAARKRNRAEAAAAAAGARVEGDAATKDETTPTAAAATVGEPHRLSCAVCGLVVPASSRAGGPGRDGDNGDAGAQPSALAKQKRAALRRKKATDALADRAATRADGLYKCVKCGRGYHRGCIEPVRWQLEHPFRCTPCLIMEVTDRPICACEPILP